MNDKIIELKKEIANKTTDLMDCNKKIRKLNAEINSLYYQLSQEYEKEIERISNE